MPFQSEKQRRYLHANHPEIAKRWERDYANGGITLPKGPAGITSLNGWGSTDASQNKAGADISPSMDKNPNDPGWGGGGGDGPPSIKNPPKGPTAEEIAAAKAKAEAEKRRLEAEARKKYVKDFKDTQKKKLQKTFGPYTPKNMYLTHQPSLSEYETEEVNDLMSRLNKMTYGGYGPYSDTWTKIQHQPSLSKYETEEVNKLIDNLNKENKAYDKSIFEKWSDHAKFSETIKNLGNTKNYHQIAALDFMNKFNVQPETAKKLSKGYQHFTEGVKAAINPFDNYTFDKAKERAETEAALNALGIDAYGKDNELTQEYATFTDAGTKKYLNKGGVARKKYSTGTSGILDIDEESEDISLTAFNPNFDDVPELTEEKEEEKINLFSETEKGDPLNELLLAEDGVTTLFRAKNGGYAVQGGVKNYLGEQEMVSAPKYWQSAPDHPETELTYITKPEKDLLVKADLHGSLHGSVNKGPQGLTSLNGWGDADDGFSDKSYGGSETYGGSDPGGDDQEDDVAQMMHDMSITPDHSPDYTGSDYGWVASEDEETEIGGADYIGPKDKVRIHNEILNRKTTWDKDKWKRDVTTLISLPTTPIGFISFVYNQNKKKNERIAEIDADLELLDKIGATKFTPHTDTLYQKLEQEKLDLTQPRSGKDDDDTGGDGPEVPVAPVIQEIQEYEQMAWDPMSYLDKIRAGQAQRASLQAKGIIQDNEIMTLNSGGLANLFTVKNYN